MVVTTVGFLLSMLVAGAPDVRIAVARGAETFLAQAPATSARTSTTFIITVPDASTELVLDGKTIPGEGTSRTFQTGALTAGTHRYTITARWQPNSYTTMTRTKTVSFRAGDRVAVDLSVDDPGDRVRVQYVPTPSDIADAMVRLAGVSSTDVVYEPGCGDARITIAAIRAGAQRGICIDIDPDRVEESRAKVKEAGLQDKIDVRLGDALDVRDLSAVTVVLLYMGDHFNLLIRPVLWKELKPGARVVSHRFLMGDWTPDKTVTISSDEGGEYILHLWTVTDELKKRIQPQR
jgi:uncharacterized protein (TIGR03000 family)